MKKFAHVVTMSHNRITIHVIHLVHHRKGTAVKVARLYSKALVHCIMQAKRL